MDVRERNKRIFNLVNNKMKYMFKEVLTQVEKESKNHDIKPSFFEKKEKPTGFYAIRKTLFDHGNNITELLGLILNELELTPVKGIVKIDDKLKDELKNDS